MNDYVVGLKCKLYDFCKILSKIIVSGDFKAFNFHVPMNNNGVLKYDGFIIDQINSSVLNLKIYDDVPLLISSYSERFPTLIYHPDWSIDSIYESIVECITKSSGEYECNLDDEIQFVCVTEMDFLIKYDNIDEEHGYELLKVKGE